jgi:Na+/proline symporter
MENILKKYSTQISTLSKFIWKLSELGLAIAIAGLVLFLLLGESSGTFPVSVAENFTQIANSLGPKGISAILAAAVFLLISKRLIDKK